MLKGLELSSISLTFTALELTLCNRYVYERRYIRTHEDAAVKTPNIGRANQNEI
jgi:hypothetical protein